MFVVKHDRFRGRRVSESSCPACGCLSVPFFLRTRNAITSVVSIDPVCVRVLVMLPAVTQNKEENKKKHCGSPLIGRCLGFPRTREYKTRGGTRRRTLLSDKTLLGLRSGQMLDYSKRYD